MARTWIELGVPKDLAEKLVALGLRRPTKTQAEAIPKLLSTNVDALICAPTGTGKTEAALIPALIKHFRKEKPISILYITPLRALNRDAKERIERVSRAIGSSVEVWHGDTPSSIRKRISENPPSILITTPESLQVVLVNQRVRPLLRNCRCVIIDEAHEIAESERGAELVIGLNRLDVLAKRHVRRIALMAPMGNLDAVANYIFYPHKYMVVDVRYSKIYDIHVDSVLQNAQLRSFLDALYSIPKLIELLKKAISNGVQTLIFVNTRIAAEELGLLLSKHLGNLGVHHGSLSKEVRELVEKKFKMRELKVVVATSSLELGIDVGGVDLVVQVMSPRQVSRLIQRVGRAGHKEEAISKGVVLAPPMLLEVLESAVIAKRAECGQLEAPTFHINPLDVVMHQLIGIALEWGQVRLSHIHKILSASTPFKSLELSKLIEVAELAKEIGFVTIDGEYIAPTKKGELYYKTTTMIVDTRKYRVKDVVGMRNVATLDEEFVVTCNIGDLIILGGKLWRIVDINEESREVLVTPTTVVEEGKPPKWVGENIPVPEEVALEVCRVIEKLCSCNDDACLDTTLSDFKLSDDARKLIKELINDACLLGISTDSLAMEVSIQRSFPYVMLYSCIGSKGSEALAILLLALLDRLFGLKGSYRAHQVGTLVILPRSLTKIEVKELINALLSLKEDEVKELVKSYASSTPIFDWYLLKVAKKMGIISHEVSLREAKRVIEGLKKIQIVKEEALRELITEKIDLEALIRFLNRLKTSRRARVYLVERPTHIAKEIISLSPARIEPTPPVSKSALLSVVLSRLTNRVVKLLCLSCLYTWSINLKLESDSLSLEELKNKRIPCPMCGSLIVTTVDDDEELRSIKSVVKRLRRGVNAKLSDDELKLLEKARRIANLLMDYGLAALIALQGVGIGPENAKRILSRASTLEELVSMIIEREATYLRTKRFWHS